MLPLKTTLTINALSSGATGVLLVVLAQGIAKLFGVSDIIPFVGTGIFLIAFGGYVFVASVRKVTDVNTVRIIIVLDVLWVIASFVLIAFTHSKLSSLGIIAIMVVAVWVAGMAFLQSRGIKFLNTGIAVFIPILLGVSLLTQQDVLGQVAYTSFRGEAEKPSTLTLYKENESLEVVTRFLEAVKEKNHAKAAPLLDSLIEWHQPGDNRYSGVKKNANEVFVMFKGFIETSANSLQLSDVKTIAVNGNSVACLLHWNAVTPHGARLDVDNIDVYTVAGGKITRCIVYSTDLEQENKFWWK